MYPPAKMGGNFEDPSSFSGMYRPRSSHRLSSSASIETIDHMRSISTFKANPPLNHSASIGARTDRERALEEATRTRHDMISGWRGVDGSGKGQRRVHEETHAVDHGSRLGELRAGARGPGRRRGAKATPLALAIRPT